ncbi:MAG: PqqD family protein [Chloroflexia bacterium]
MDLLSRRFQKHPDIVFRRIGDEFVLVPIRSTVADLEAIYTLNPVAAHIWDLLDGQRDGYAILEEIVREYDVSPEQARGDLIEFLEQLLAVQGIVAVEDISDA